MYSENGNKSKTYMSIVVEEVIGEFEFVEGDDLFHPLRTLGGWIRVNVDPPRHLRISFPRYNPRRRVETTRQASPIFTDRQS